MLFFKHSLSLLTLNLLLRAHYAFCEEDHTPFETEFRLMILTMYGREDPDGVEVTVEGQLGVESVDSHDNKNGVNIDWGIGSYLGSSRLTYMGWSHPNPNGRAVWIYRKGEDKESGMKCTVSLNHDPKVPRLDWYLSWGLDFDSTINAFENVDGLKIDCVQMSR